MAVPVAGASRLTLQPKVSDLSNRHRLSLLVENFRLTTRYDSSTGARAYLSRRIGNENVQRLRRPNSIQNLNSKTLREPLVQCGRQSLSRGHAQANTGKIQ